MVRIIHACQKEVSLRPGSVHLCPGPSGPHCSTKTAMAAERHEDSRSLLASNCVHDQQGICHLPTVRKEIIQGYLFPMNSGNLSARHSLYLSHSSSISGLLNLKTIYSKAPLHVRFFVRIASLCLHITFSLFTIHEVENSRSR